MSRRLSLLVTVLAAMNFAAPIARSEAPAPGPSKFVVAVGTVRSADEEDLRDGIELALDEWKMQPHPPVQISTEWIALPPGVTAGDLQGLSTSLHPVALIARAPAASATALAQACTTAKLPCIILSPFAPPEGSTTFAFQLWPSLISSRAAVSSALRLAGARRIVLLSYAQQSSPAEVSGLTKSLQKDAIAVVGSGSLAPGGGVPPDLDQLLQTRPDAFLLDIPAPLVASVASELRYRGFVGKIVTPDPLSEVELRHSGSALEGVTFTALAPPAAAARGALRKRFGEVPENSDVVRFAHDAAMILMETLADEDTENSPEGIRDYLQHRKRFDGYLGAFSFTAGGRASLPLMAYRNTGGTIEAIAR